MPLTTRRTLGAALLCAALTLPLPARAADWTDIWYTAAEPGWGVNVVQADTFLFLTFFIYGADGKPTWYTGQLTWDGARYSGGLYATRGTYWALPWNPADHPAATQAGTAGFTPSTLNAYQATLSYSVNGIGTVSKAVERQTLTTIVMGGAYVGGQSGQYSSCPASANNRPYTDTYSLAVTQASGIGTFVFSYGSGATCTMSGALEQHGQLYTIPAATYRCTGTLTTNTTATMYELKATAQGVEGRLVAGIGNGCREDAQFSAVLQ